MRTIALVFSLLVVSKAFSQSSTGFQPSPIYPSDSTKVVADLNRQYEAFVKGLPSKTHPKFLEFYEGRHEYVVRSLRRGNFLFHAEMEAYFNTILKEIYRANPDIPAKNIKLFLSRVPEPNASSLGDGVLLFNIGLLSRLENESQIAFILCHEIAHYKLNHSEESLRKYIETTESKETNKKLEKIANQETGVYQKASELLKTIVYDDRRSSRKHEREADSLGLKYLRNTRYDAREALRSMQILDTIDEEKYTDSLDLRSCLNTPSFPFKQEWLHDEVSSLAFSESAIEKDETFNEDSLRTHPDCPERLHLMEKMLADYPAQGNRTDFQDGGTLKAMVHRADLEIVESYFHFELSGECLFHALKLLKYYPEEPYLQGKIGMSLYMLHRALVEHDLDHHIPLPSPNMEPDFRKYVEFVHKLRSRELAKLGYSYINDKKDLPKDNEDVLAAFALTAKIMEKPDEYQRYKAQYFTAFPDGRYVDMLKD